MPQFVDETAAIAPQLLLLGVLVTLTALVCDLIVVAGTSKLSDWVLGNRGVWIIQAWVSGLLLIGIGTYMLLAELYDLM